MTDADLAIGEEGYEAAKELAKKGEVSPNLTLAINDEITHSWRTAKEVYDRLQVATSKSEADQALRKLGTKFMDGKRVGYPSRRIIHK